MSGSDAAVSNRERRFGELLLRRATGRADEMHSARSLCRMLAPMYVRGDRVLDAGCGAAHYLRSLRARIDPDLDYNGIDRSEHFVSLARQAFPELARERLRVADIGDLPFGDEAFELVLCANVLPNLPPPPTRALHELLRVAGRAVIVRTLFGEIDYVVREFDELAHPEDLAREGGVFNNIYSESTYRAMIESAPGKWEVRIERDTDWEPFDGRADVGGFGTRTVGDRQISGQLLLDWRFIVISRARDAA